MTPSDAGRLAIDGGTPVRADFPPIGKGVTLLGDAERDAVLEVIESRSLFRYYGPDLRHKVDSFEAAAKSFLGAAHAVAVSSGTAALRCALAALGVGCGDEVILPALTFIASVNAVVVAGAVPIFAEIDHTLGLDPDDVDAKITPRTAAIIPVHLDNGACDMDPIMEVARRRGVPVIEDTAQAMGAVYKGRALGTIGDLGCYSLQLEKNVTSGEGGLVVSDDEELWLRAARYQDQGGQFVTSTGGSRGAEVDAPFVGENLRMTEIAGAIAEVQLGRLAHLLDAQRRNQRHVLDGIAGIGGLGYRRRPDPLGDGGSSVNLFLPDRETARRFVRALRAERVPAGQLYNGNPVYLTPSIVEKRTASGKGGPWHCAEHPTDVEYGPGLCPRSEDLAGRAVIVPIGAAYSEADCDDVVTAIGKVCGALIP
ncbi:MAG TPA: aminotransferase class I/II-fold pyridoxal phosphate-dependent enzyme [Acidimicrobiales bacterium]|nr:aminotransferase class I/II-fold pyridoxal phosphate-dependent enzyme [Acidimicrobiales bacterium]